MKRIKNHCQVQDFSGTHCRREAVTDQKCFWHSDLPKTNANVRKYFPRYTGIKEIIEKEQPSLEKAHFTNADLSGIDFSGLKLRGALFKKANLRESILVKTDLRSSDLTDVDLENGDLTEANLTKAALTRSNLKGAKLDRAVLQDTKLNEVDLSFSSLRGVGFKSTRLYFVNLYKANLDGAHFSNRTSQLALCNTEDPNNEEYFEKKILAWIETPGRHGDVLTVLKFYKDRLEQGRFTTWLHDIFVSVREQYQQAREKRNINELADIWQFVGQACKITGQLPVFPALPAAQESISQHEEFLQIRATLKDDRISAKELADYLVSLSTFCKAIASVKRDVSSHPEVDPHVVSINFSSPLEIVLVVTVGLGSLILCVLNIYEKYLLVSEKRFQLQQMRRENQRKLQEEVRQKLRKQFPDISEDNTNRIVVHVHNHINFVQNSEQFLVYDVATADTSARLKGAEQIQSSSEKRKF